MRENAPSATAYLIAASIAYSARDPALAFLLPPQAAPLSDWVLADSLPWGRYLLWALQRTWFRALIRLAERATLPGIQAHYLVRKRRIEELTRTALQEGVRQVVVLGAGFDSLCWRLHSEYETALFFEVDHPGTQQVKRAVLERRAMLRPNLQFLAVNLILDDLEAHLRAAPRFDPGLPTLFVMEGLLMYLAPAEVEQLFRSLRFPECPQTRVVFTFLEPQPDGRVNFPHASPLVSWWLRQRGESFRWGIRREALPDTLAALGFRLVEVSDDADFRRRYLTAPFLENVPLAAGEFLGAAVIHSDHLPATPSL
jgi:methyltransferase (TIGR00027 family)